MTGFFKTNQREKSCGFIAISTVVIILAVIIALTLVMSYAAINEAQSGLALYLGEESFTFVEGCVEDVMLKIRNDGTYSGTSITRPEGTCQIIYNAGTSRPTNWDITVTTTATDYHRTLNVIFTRDDITGLTVSNWVEI